MEVDSEKQEYFLRLLPFSCFSIGGRRDLQEM
jgi:hypothetical protein